MVKKNKNSMVSNNNEVVENNNTIKIDKLKEQLNDIYKENNENYLLSFAMKHIIKNLQNN